MNDLVSAMDRVSALMLFNLALLLVILASTIGLCLKTHEINVKLRGFSDRLTEISDTLERSR